MQTVAMGGTEVLDSTHPDQNRAIEIWAVVPLLLCAYRMGSAVLSIGMASAHACRKNAPGELGTSKRDDRFPRRTSDLLALSGEVAFGF